MQSITLEPINDKQEVFDVCGHTLEQQGYTVEREDDTLLAEAGSVFLRRKIAVIWSTEHIEVVTKGSNAVMSHDIKVLTDVLDSLRTIMNGGQFTEAHRIFNYSNKHF